MSEYWKKRQQELNASLEEDEAALRKRLSSYYAAEEKKLDRQIAGYYAAYGEDNVIAYRKLLQSLSEGDKQLLMRDMDSFGEKYPQYKDLLPVRASVYQLNRLEGLQYSVQLQQLEIAAKEESEVQAHLEQLAGRCFDSVQQDIGAGQTFNRERADVIKTAVGNNWTGTGNFSDRIWKNREELSKTLETEVAAGFARGDDYKKLTQMIQHKFNVGANEAYRLIYTEGTYVMNESKAQAIGSTFEYYAVVTVGDERVCDICERVQSETQWEPVKLAERQAGDNFPPLHPRCRCTFCTVVPNRSQWIDEYVTKHGGDPDRTAEQKALAQELLDKYAANVNSVASETKSGYTESTTRTKEEYTAAAKTYCAELESLTGKASKWSGNINVADSLDDNVLGVKEWNCDISVLKNVDDGVLIHELLHSFSASYSDQNAYAQNQRIEEGAVEYLKRLVCEEKGITSVSAYDRQADTLAAIDKGLDYGGKAFAKELINVPLSKRYDWFENKVADSLRERGASFEDFNDVIGFVRDNLRGSFKNGK